MASVQTARSLVAAAAVLVLAACPPEPAKLPTERIESGFVMSRDAFPFANFGGRNEKTALNAKGLVRMFGAEGVCATVEEDGTCRAAPIAKEFMKLVNEAMKGGRCEGFAVLSNLIRLGQVNPADLGIANAGAATLESEAVLRDIGYWFGTQYLRGVVKSSTSKLNALQLLTFLTTEFSKPEHDMFRIGIVRIGDDGRATGGHAIVPVAVLPGDGKNKYVVKVYDNNHPDAEKDLLIDVAENRWEYQASSNPSEQASLYVGTVELKNPVYLTSVTPRVGQHACAFCSDDPEEGEAALNQVFTFGSAEVSATDENGQRVGEVDGRLVEEVPGAVAAPTFTAETWADRSPPLLLLPRGAATRLQVRPGQGEEPATVALFRPGAMAGIEGATIQPGKTEQLEVGADGASVKYTPSEGNSPVLFAGRETESGTQTSVRVELPAGGAVSEASIGIDAQSGDAKLEAKAEAGEVELQVEVTKATETGEDTFAGGLAVPTEGSATLQVDEWEGAGAQMGAAVDVDGDGQSDETRVVTNTGTEPVAPPAPTGLSAVATAIDRIELTWTDASETEEQFVVERDSGVGFESPVALAANTTSLVDTSGVRHSRTFRYRVRATNRYGNSDWSPVVEVATPGCPATTQDNDANGTCEPTCASAALACGRGACDDADGTAGCACDTGYTGAGCDACAATHQDVDFNGTCEPTCETAALTCGNGACSDTDGTADCACNAGYAGTSCETCAPSHQDRDANGSCLPTCSTAALSCGNGACSDASGAAACVCDPGYVGASCNACETTHQDNDGNGTCAPTCATAGLSCGNGSCSDTGGTATCVCDAGYSGAACDTCAASHQDNDGNGTCAPTCATAALGCVNGACSDTGGTAACVCSPGYAGATCSTCAATHQDNDGDQVCAPTCATANLACGNGACSDAAGAAACVCSVGYQTGTTSTALSFDGVNERVVTSSITLGSTWSYETWVKLDPSTGDYDGIITARSDVGTGSWIQLAVSATGRVRFQSNAPAHDLTDIGPVVTDNAWHHVAATCDGSAARIYVDGTQATQFASTCGSMNRPLFLMAERLATYHTPGLIDETMVWSSARSAAQIAADMRGGVRGTEPGLVLYYDYEDGSGTAVTDRAGGDHPGTLLNMESGDWTPVTPPSGSNWVAACGACAATHQDNDRNGTCLATCATAALTCAVGSCLDADGTADCSCGDGVLAAGEQCDDGNLRGEDGCRSTCVVDPNAVCAGAGAGSCVNDGIVFELHHVDGDAIDGNGTVALRAFGSTTLRFRHVIVAGADIRLEAVDGRFLCSTGGTVALCASAGSAGTLWTISAGDLPGTARLTDPVGGGRLRFDQGSLVATVQRGGESLTDFDRSSAWRRDVLTFGGSGGSRFNLRCAAQSVLVGFDIETQASSGDAISRIGSVCGPVTYGVAGASIGATTTIAPPGGAAGTPVSLRCPSNNAVSGFRIRSSTGVERLELQCAPLSSVPDQATYRLVRGSALAGGTSAGGLGGTDRGVRACPGSGVATGIVGGSGLFQDSFGVSCSATSEFSPTP